MFFSSFFSRSYLFHRKNHLVRFHQSQHQPTILDPEFSEQLVKTFQLNQQFLKPKLALGPCRLVGQLILLFPLLKLALR